MAEFNSYELLKNLEQHVSEIEREEVLIDTLSLAGNQRTNSRISNITWNLSYRRARK